MDESRQILCPKCKHAHHLPKGSLEDKESYLLKCASCEHVWRHFTGHMKEFEQKIREDIPPQEPTSSKIEILDGLRDPQTYHKAVHQYHMDWWILFIACFVALIVVLREVGGLPNFSWLAVQCENFIGYIMSDNDDEKGAALLKRPEKNPVRNSPPSLQNPNADKVTSGAFALKNISKENIQASHNSNAQGQAKKEDAVQHQTTSPKKEHASRPQKTDIEVQGTHKKPQNDGAPPSQVQNSSPEAKPNPSKHTLPVYATTYIKSTVLASHLSEEKGASVLTIKGEIRNSGKGLEKIPPLFIKLYDDTNDGEMTLRCAWPCVMSKAELGAGETYSFETKVHPKEHKIPAAIMITKENEA